MPKLLAALLFPIVVTTDPAQTGLDPARLARIPARMKQFVDAGQAAGIVTLVARHGHIAALDAVGYTDFDTRQPMQVDNIFQIHSMTKPVVCLAALLLAEEGKLALGDLVSAHLPEFRGGAPITIRHLMTHTSGLPLNPPPGIGELHGALHKPLSDVALILSQTPVEFQPGTKWSYSNTGIAVLARIVEVKSGQRLEDFLAERIFKPLDMEDTYIFPPASKHHRMPTAYLLKDGKPVKYTSDPLGEGAMKFRTGAKYSLPEGGIYSTASDLYRLYQMMLNGGTYNRVRLISKAALEVMTTNHTGTLPTGTAGAGWGLGNFVVTEPAGTLGFLSIGSYGHGGRYGTFYAIDPKRDLIAIFMIHREGGSAERNAFLEMAIAAAQ
jgi:CubicO group peptidase (beta-lactamase class C family)